MKGKTNSSRTTNLYKRKYHPNQLFRDTSAHISKEYGILTYIKAVI